MMNLSLAAEMAVKLVDMFGVISIWRFIDDCIQTAVRQEACISQMECSAFSAQSAC